MLEGDILHLCTTSNCRMYRRTLFTDIHPLFSCRALMPERRALLRELFFLLTDKQEPARFGAGFDPTAFLSDASQQAALSDKVAAFTERWIREPRYVLLVDRTAYQFSPTRYADYLISSCDTSSLFLFNDASLRLGKLKGRESNTFGTSPPQAYTSSIPNTTRQYADGHVRRGSSC